MRSCGFKSHLPHEKERPQINIWGLFFFRTEADLDPWSKVSASLRSVQNRGPPDLVHPIFRVFPNSSSASPRSPRHDYASSVGSEEKRFPEPFFLSSSPHLPYFLECFTSRSKVSASLRSVQNRGPLDLVHPIFRILFFFLLRLHLGYNFSILQ